MPLGLWTAISPEVSGSAHNTRTRSQAGLQGRIARARETRAGGARERFARTGGHHVA
jgi:hypothetical protein